MKNVSFNMRTDGTQFAEMPGCYEWTNRLQHFCSPVKEWHQHACTSKAESLSNTSSDSDIVEIDILELA